LDVVPCRVRFEKRVIDHRRDAGWGAAKRVETDAGGAGVDDAAQPIGTTLLQHRVALTSRARLHTTVRLQFFDDDRDQPLDLFSGHLIARPDGRAYPPRVFSRSRIFASRVMYRGSRIDVVNQVVPIVFASSTGPSVAPRVRTF